MSILDLVLENNYTTQTFLTPLLWWSTQKYKSIAYLAVHFVTHLRTLKLSLSSNTNKLSLTAKDFTYFQKPFFKELTKLTCTQ